MRYNIDSEFGIYAKLKPPLNPVTVAFADKVLAFSATCLKTADVSVSDVTLPTGASISLIGDLTESQRPWILFYHGGGFCYPAAPYHYRIAVKMVKEWGVGVAFVNYRLTPKHTAADILCDVRQSVDFLLENKTITNKLAFYGDSAGGYLAIEATLYALSIGVRPWFLMTPYPVIDPTVQTRSKELYTDTPLWNTRCNKKMWEWFQPDPSTLPLQQPIPSDFPSTYIETAQYDCLHDEALIFAKRLKQADVPITVYETEHTMHGYEIKDGRIFKNAFQHRTEFIDSLSDTRSENNRMRF